MAKLDSLRRKYNETKIKGHEKAVHRTISDTKRDLSKADKIAKDNELLKNRLDAAKKLNEQKAKTLKLKAELAKYKEPNKLGQIADGLKREIKDMKKNNPKTFKAIKKIFG